jgi:hypothetical protein
MTWKRWNTSNVSPHFRLFDSDTRSGVGEPVLWLEWTPSVVSFEKCTLFRFPDKRS